jgi:hypothetical protein
MASAAVSWRGGVLEWAAWSGAVTRARAVQGGQRRQAPVAGRRGGARSWPREEEGGREKKEREGEKEKRKREKGKGKKEKKEKEGKEKKNGKKRGKKLGKSLEN